MQINREAGVVYDAIAYTVNHFNMEKVRTSYKIYAKNDEDNFVNYYKFMKYLGFEPSDDLYFFFIYNESWPNMMTKYCDKCFSDFSFTLQGILNEVRDISKLKEFAYHHILEFYKEEVNIDTVIKGNAEQTSLAVTLLAIDHPKFARQAHKLFYKFDNLTKELIRYFEILLDKLNQFNKKIDDKVYHKIIKNFINCPRINEFKKEKWWSKELDLNKQLFAVSFFRNFVVKAPENLTNSKTLIIGDKSDRVLTGRESNNRYITKKFTSSLFTTQILNDIINVLIEKGEKSALQLSFIITYDVSYITKKLRVLENENVVYVSRKEGNKYFYKINIDFLRVMKIAFNE